MMAVVGPARRWIAALLVASPVVVAAAVAPPSGGALEVPEVIRLGAGGLGGRRVFEAEPIRVRVAAARDARVVRLRLEVPDERWRGAEVTFTTRPVRGCRGIRGTLVPGTPTPVLHTEPGGAGAEAEIVLRIAAPARSLGAGPRALILRWELVGESATVGPASHLGTPGGALLPPGASPLAPPLPGGHRGAGGADREPGAALRQPP